MINSLNKQNCCGCESCIQICPKQCISLNEDKEGFRYPSIDLTNCIQCNLCEKVCPGIQQNKSESGINLISYAAINKSDSARFNSSSGGVFQELAKYIIEKKNGIVYGASLIDSETVQHIRVTDTQDIIKLQKSKYIQSYIGKAFKKVKRDLIAQRIVLFSGTPCQIKALHLFLRNVHYPNLFTLDIACHGIPSSKIWKIYLSSLNLEKSNLLVDFRDKNAAWHNYTLSISQQDTSKKIVFERCDKNIFMRGFIYNLYNRPSCHHCPAKEFTSGSDITLADYWGIEKFYPELDDNKGTSLVITKGEKGEFLFSNIKQHFKYQQTDFKTVECRKETFYTCSSPHYKRQIFFRKVTPQNIEKLINKYLKHSYPINIRILRFIKHFIFPQ